MLKRTMESLQARGMGGTLPLAPAVAIEAVSGLISGPVRRRYVKRIAAEALAPLALAPPIMISVATFAQEIDVPELVLSVRSFLEYVGVPQEFVVVSDGTITDESSRLVCSIWPSVISVQSVAEYGGPGMPKPVREFIAKSVWGGKLATIMAMSDRAPSLYIDADVLCFPSARELRSVFEGSVPRFLLDAGPYLDQRMLPDEPLKDVEMPVNAGMLFVPRPLDWTLSISRLRSLLEDPTGPSAKSEQTAVHVALHHAGARPFPPDRYVVSPLRMRPHHRVRRREICARHYTRPQRGLFWLEVARYGLQQNRRAKDEQDES